LEGLSIGHGLLNLVPSRTPGDRHCRAGSGARKITQLEFPVSSKSFGTVTAAAFEFAAVQRGWRDFRIAQ